MSVIISTGDVTAAVGAALVTAETYTDAALVTAETYTDAALGHLQKRTLTVGFGSFTADAADLTQTFNLGAVLPAGAVPVATQINLATPFVGDAAPGMNAGVAGGFDLTQNFDTTQTAAKYIAGPPIAAQLTIYDGAQLTLKFTPAAGKKLKTDSSAGSVTATVWFFAGF